MELNEWAEKRIDLMLRYPPLFGSLEAVEMQVLLLLEVQEVSQGRDGNRLLELYRKQLGSAYYVSGRANALNFASRMRTQIEKTRKALQDGR